MMDLNRMNLINRAHTAIEHNNLDDIKKLIDQGMDINLVDEFGESLLVYACNSNRLDMAKWLIENDICIHITYGMLDKTLLMRAAMTHLSFVQLFLEAGARLQAFDKRGCCPAMYSLICDKEDIFHFLMNAGTDINDLFCAEKMFYYYLAKPFVASYIESNAHLLTPESEIKWKQIRLKKIFT